jgi:hypothetical protein
MRTFSFCVLRAGVRQKKGLLMKTGVAVEKLFLGNFNSEIRS